SFSRQLRNWRLKLFARDIKPEVRFFLIFAFPIALFLYSPSLQAPLYLDDENVLNGSDSLPNLAGIDPIHPARTLTQLAFWASHELADLFRTVFPWRRPFY